MNRATLIAAAGALGAALAAPALAQTVKVTPLGGIDGEFCPQDRAPVPPIRASARSTSSS